MRSDWPVSALAQLAAMLGNCEARWVVGGSTGLALRGAHLDRAPRDLDIYVDNDTVDLVHERLQALALDGPVENTTERYYSTLSHYRIDDTMVELVGSFRVSALECLYITEVNGFLYPNCDKIDLDGHEVPLVPLGHELIFNLLRERQDRALVAGKLIAADPLRHLPLLQRLIGRNAISNTIAEEALRLASSNS
ncbi:nucleotidyltransferase domain-containing protein [Cohnella cholangitidis]|uniref:Nucleotidyl transferase AbiEii/AbiGii toxin family protein n=1 Tax=Cohnella cholangitidis TaxID=2598458 RepID=A0A7G5C580_9BACL|nr:hypothetical protein [Cohnella cholangitidis]QMV44364.1 hypothetical protein FPL14_26755 [Cohnella cholangitidis]